MWGLRWEGLRGVEFRVVEGGLKGAELRFVVLRGRDLEGRF